MRALAVLWHGRGPRESAVLQPLVRGLVAEGHDVLAVDWDSGAPDGGRSALLGSLRGVTRPCVVVGWSLGGTAALSLLRGGGALPAVDGVVGLAADVREVSPLDGLVPEAVTPGARLQLVHGRHDSVVPVEAAIAFAGTSGCPLTVVDSDHAGVVGTRYDPAVRACVPSEGPRARVGLAAALAAFDAVVRQP